MEYLRRHQVTAVIGMDRVWGNLSVEDGRVTFVPSTSRVSRGVSGASQVYAPLVHTERSVAMVRARMMVPTVGLAVLLRSDLETGSEVRFAVHLPGWDRRPLRDALAAAGFEVVERRSWLSLGGEWVNAGY